LVDPPHFPLTILVAPGAQLNLTIEYSQQRFADVTMLRFLQHFGLLLEALTVTPDWHLLDLPLLLDEEKPDETPSSTLLLSSRTIRLRTYLSRL
jgi:hypothetical protein